jgi:hypothetical protein
MSDVDLLVVEKHTVDSLDGAFGGLGGLIMDEAVPFRSAVFIRGDFAGKNIAERGKGVVKSLSPDRQQEVTRHKQRKRTLLSIASSRFLMNILP